MERQRDREMRVFSFIFEIYNLYFSIFQDNYVVLLMNFSSINFDFNCRVTICGPSPKRMGS